MNIYNKPILTTPPNNTSYRNQQRVLNSYKQQPTILRTTAPFNNDLTQFTANNNNSIESEKEDLFRKYDTYELSEEKNEPKLIDISTNTYNSYDNNSTVEYDYKGSNANYQKMTIKYQTEIAKLKAKMASMIKDNEEISARLEREKKRKEELIKRQKEKKDKEEKIINSSNDEWLPN